LAKYATNPTFKRHEIQAVLNGAVSLPIDFIAERSFWITDPFRFGRCKFLIKKGLMPYNPFQISGSADSA
jgi:hypothetical protein